MKYTQLILVSLTILTIFGSTFGADDTFTPQTLANTYGGNANNASEITFSKLPQGNSYKVSDSYSQGVLAPLYKMSAGFVNTVQPSDPDYIKDLIKELVKGNFGYVTNDIMGALKNFAGIMACLVIGIIFIGFFPLIGLCFCCCRCCGNCGGSRHVTKKYLSNANCLCTIYSVVVFVLFLFLLTGSLLVYKSSESMVNSMTGMGKTFTTNIDDMETFLDNTVKEIKHITSEHFNFTVDVIGRDLDNIGYIVGVPIRQELLTKGGVQAVVDAIKNLDSTLATVGSSMLTVNSSIAYVKANATALSNALSTAKTNLDTALGQAGCAGGCSGFDTSKLAMDFDPNSMPDITSEVNSINDVMKVNLTERAVQGYNEVETVPTRVKNETKSTVQNIKTLLNDFKGTISKQVDKINDLPNELTSTTKDIKKDINNIDDMLNKYDLYRQIFGIILASIVLLVAILQCLGLIAGVCTYRKDEPPTKRSCMANSGADCLMASVGFVFIFAWLMMLFTTLTFLIGAPLKKFMCGPLTDPNMALIKELLDTPGGIFNNYFLGEMILQNGTIPLTFSGLLLGCKQDKAAMDVMKLDALFDINKVTDYKSSIDIDKQLDAINVDLSDVKVMSADTEKQLVDFRNAVNIDFAGFTTELDKNTTQADLRAFAQAVKSLGDASTNPAQSSLYSSASEILAIDSNEYSAAVAAQKNLKDGVTNLQSAVTSVPTSVNNTIDSAKAVDNYLNTTGATLIKNEAKKFANRILNSADQFVNNTKKLIYNDVGKCRPVWNVWNSLANVLLCQQIVDSLGGFWFSMGWCTFFMTLTSIFNVKLAKYFRKMKSVDSDKNPLINGSQASGLQMSPMKKKNKIAPYDL